MADLFDNEIICKKCKKTMKKGTIEKNGFELRAVQCPICHELIVHPSDEQEYRNFVNLKKKEFNVKMRMVGNSYAVSIPRQIVDFMKEQEQALNDMVRLCFEGANKLSLNFGQGFENESVDSEANGTKSHLVRSKEIRIVRNGKPVLHIRKHFDSADPKKNVNQVFKSKDFKSESKGKEVDVEKERDR